MAHITGGGFIDNIPRVLPDGVAAHLNLDAIKVPAVFGWLAKEGGVAQDEMLRTFNCGIGMIVVVDPAQEKAVSDAFIAAGEHPVRVGALRTQSGEARVTHQGHLAL